MAKQGDGRQDERLVTPDMLLPDMVAKFPVTRQVLDKNGLKGCGGPTGPCEPVAWFSRLHNVPLQQLLDELNEAARQSLQGGETTIRFEPTFADTIYQPYFAAASLLAVVFGAFWGAVSLAVMGITGGMQFAVPYGWLLAHGQTMLGGFVVLMAMGFSFQAFPRFKHSELQLPHLALATLPLLLLGIALQTFAHFFVPPPIFQTAQPVVHRSFAHWSFAHWSLVIATLGTFLEKLIWAALEGCYDPEIPERKVPKASSSCSGMDKIVGSPGFPIWRWLPRILKRCHPAFSNAFAASSHEMSRGSRNLQPSTFSFASVSCHSWMPRS
jgi:hypothetical protein